MNASPPLPVSIAVRNLFPPLAIADDDIIAPIEYGSGSNAKGYCEGEGKDSRVAVNVSPSKHQILREKIKSTSLVEDRCTLVSRDVLLRLRLDIVAKKLPKENDSGAQAQEEVTATAPNEGGCTDDDDADEQQILLLYSSEQSHCTAHPRWDHIDEQLATKSSLDSSSGFNLYARFAVLDDTKDTDTTQSSTSTSPTKEWILAEISLHPSQLRRIPPSKVNDDDYSNNVAATSNNNNNKNNNSMIIPNSLPPNTILLHYNDGYTRVLPNIYWLLVQRGIIKESVMDPLKRSGSGGYRVERSDNGYVKEIDHDDVDDDEEDDIQKEGKKEQSLFEEKAFDVLGVDSATTAPEHVGEEEGGGGGGDSEKVAIGVPFHFDSPNKSQKNVYHDEDKVFDLLGKPSAEIISSSIQQSPSLEAVKSSESVFDDRALNLVGGGQMTEKAAAAGQVEAVSGEPPELVPETNNVVESDGNEAPNEMELLSKQSSTEPGIPSDDGNGNEDTNTQVTSPPLQSLPESLTTTDASDTKASQEEIEELRRLIRIEQQMLGEEEQQIIEGTFYLKSIMQQVHQLEHETLEIMKAVGAERANLFQSNFRLEAHRIHLLQHLQLIFPIKLVPINITVNPPNYPQHQYTIASLPIPDDIHNPTVTDDQVSTALGFVCHLVSLTSKYLGIPLRYTLVCKFSRSAVLFDQPARRNITTDHGNNGNSSSKVVYPLFRERGVIDREQLDYGLMLLERNVHCMLRVRKVDYGPEWNVLAKMDKLLMQMIEGEDPSLTLMI